MKSNFSKNVNSRFGKWMILVAYLFGLFPLFVSIIIPTTLVGGLESANELVRIAFFWCFFLMISIMLIFIFRTPAEQCRLEQFKICFGFVPDGDKSSGENFSFVTAKLVVLAIDIEAAYKQFNLLKVAESKYSAQVIAAGKRQAAIRKEKAFDAFQEAVTLAAEHGYLDGDAARYTHKQFILEISNT